jgi:hypothetical protein
VVHPFKFSHKEALGRYIKGQPGKQGKGETLGASILGRTSEGRAQGAKLSGDDSHLVAWEPSSFDRGEGCSHPEAD